MYYTVNVAVVNYFGTQIPETEKIDGHMQTESAELYGKDLTEAKDHFTGSDIYYLKTQWLSLLDLQEESYEMKKYWLNILLQIQQHLWMLWNLLLIR